MGIAIETRGLSKTYRGGVQALKGVDITVDEGVCYGLLGPNGAGKSTLVKALLSIVRPTAGSGTILGIDCRDPAARKRIGYLPEGHQFPSYLTGRTLCRYLGKLSGLSGPPLEADIREKLALVGMTDTADRKISKYSKGMKQRVGVAQALLGDPKVVFLDEPTDGVDPVGRSELRVAIRHIVDSGVTVFLNSHLLSEVEMICDRVAIMNRGAVLTEGSVSEISASMTSGSKVLVRFRTSPLRDALWATLAARGAERTDEQRFHVAVDAEADITTWIDELRAAQVDIYAVEPDTTSLEDAFMQLIRGEGGSAP